MFGIGFTELALIIIAALIFIGPKKLPEIAKAAGRMFGELKGAMDELKHQVTEASFEEKTKEKASYYRTGSGAAGADVPEGHSTGPVETAGSGVEPGAAAGATGAAEDEHAGTIPSEGWQSGKGGPERPAGPSVAEPGEVAPRKPKAVSGRRKSSGAKPKRTAGKGAGSGEKGAGAGGRKRRSAGKKAVPAGKKQKTGVEGGKEGPKGEA